MSLPLTVIVSGCHSGPNPSPGLGIARSSRQAYPGMQLIARDFSSAATGLHAEVFDQVWVCPPWDDAHLPTLGAQLVSRLHGAWLISGLDLEVRWLAGLGHPRVLTPPISALDRVAKPALASRARLPVRVPDWLPLSAGEREVHTFCRRHDWRVWVKGPSYESRLGTSWPELRRAACEIGQTWGSERLFVQADVPGNEVSVAYAAHQGEFLGAVFMEKLAMTDQGKAWSGAISEVPAPLESALREVLRELNWTGGGELEFVRDAAGELWLFDWNPRFPAWIHGATLAGVNLPARLLERASGHTATSAAPQSNRFVRVVLEVPARDDLPLERPSSSVAGVPPTSKHPSGMPQLARRLGRTSTGRAASGLTLPENLVDDLLEATTLVGSTPKRVLLPRTAESRFSIAADLRTRARVDVAYSIKTNPDTVLMALARRHGCLAEAISDSEIGWALANDWSPSQMVVNGPVPLSSGVASCQRIGAIFADSVAAFRDYLRMSPAEVVGVRVRPPGVTSRFGVPLDDPRSFGALVEACRDAPSQHDLGISFHVQSSEVGTRRWERLARQVGHFAAAIQDLTGGRFSLVNLGGGWTPDDFDEVALTLLPDLARWFRSELGDGVTLLIELGKALAETSQAVLTRVVDIRQVDEVRRDAILDGGLSVLPQVAAFPHRVALVRGGTVEPLGPGPDALLGPLCMEGDQLAEAIALPSDLMVGDLVAFCDAGAYDASMAYDFGRGSAAAHDPAERT